MAIDSKFIPRHQTEVVVEVLSGPDGMGRHRFDAYWVDEYTPSGVRSQCFHGMLDAFTTRFIEKGRSVRIAD